MPKSATGWNKAGWTEAGRIVPFRARGFTLIEILVVVLIASVLTGIAMLRFAGESPAERVQAERDRLVARFDQMCDLALMTGQPRGLRLTGNGYDFWHYERSAWRALGPGSKPEARAWPETLSARLTVEGEPILPGETAAPHLTCSALEPLPDFELRLSIERATTTLSWPVN